jgi:predicted outer membrane protein
MSITPAPNMPDSSAQQRTASPTPPIVFEQAATPRWIIAALVILLLGVAYLAYAGYSTRTQLQTELGKSNDRAEQMSVRLDQANSRIAELRGQLEVTTGKLGMTREEVARARSLANQIQQDQKASDSQLTNQIGQVQKESDAKISQVSTDLSGAKGDLASARKDLDATNAKLTSTIGDLGVHSGLIAKNSEELEQLRRMGERNIFDFTLTKAKNPQKVGPVQVKLTKVDTKHYKYTMTVWVDDKQIEKKDKTADEPVQFYVHGARAPYEIVVFEVGKDKVTGYLSTPKDVASAAPAPAPKPQG